MATGGETETGEVNGQTNKILGIKDLNDVISTLERSGFSEDKWNDLGLKLHIIETKLNTVRANNPLNVKGCLKDCLVLWLEQSYDTYEYGLPTLPLLAAAVEEMGLRAVATGISPGNTQSQTQSPKEIEHIIEVYSSNYIKDLNGKFALFMADLLDRLSNHVKNGVIEFIRMARSIGQLIKVKGLASVASVDELFDSINEHYSYLNCDHIEFAVKNFLTDKDQDLKDRMEAYVKDLQNFKTSIKLRQLKKALDSVRLTHSHSSCKVVIKLVGEWENEPLAKLEDFLKQYFKKDSLFNLARVTDGCISVTFLVPLSFSQYLIDTATPQLKSMYRVGVLQLVINDVVLLDGKDDINLNESLIEAVKLGEAFEVSLLLSLGADPYYEDSNGDKVLGVALHGGNEEITELISVATDTQVMELGSENENLKVEIQRLQDSNTAASKSEIDELQDTVSSDDSRILQNTLSSLEANILSLRNVIKKNAGTEEIAILREKISSLSLELLKQPSRTGLCEDKSNQSEVITSIKTMDQSVQSVEMLLPEIDRNKTKLVGMLTIDDASSTGATIASSPRSLTTTTAEIYVPKSKSREFSSIRASLARMIFKVSKAITQKSPPLIDLKSLICLFNSDLKAKLAECNDISSVVYVIEGECSLTDVELLETVVEEFEVTEAERYIEQYKTTLEKFCHSLSIDLCLREKFDAVNTSPSLKCETATYVFDWRPDEKKLKDICDILTKTSGKFVKIKYIERSD